MRFKAAFLLCPALICPPLFGQTWVPQESGVTASLRGIHAISAQVVWASGSAGTWLRTVDGGRKWKSGKVTGGEQLDFRGIQAFSAAEAIVMSSGEGLLSKVFATTDGGAHWQLLFENPDAKGFFDGMAFSDRRHGALMGDPVGGHLVVFVTSDGGKTWIRRKGPEAHEGEAGFAASNSTLRVRGREIWIASGGKGGARVFLSSDAGGTWTAVQTPVRHDVDTAGIFSLGWNRKAGVVVGGDYRKDTEAAANIAITSDGGRTWGVAAQGPGGFRSAVEYLKTAHAWIATGTSGSDISTDGKVWRKFDDRAFNALSGGWAVGPKGQIAKLHSLPPR